MHILSVYIFQVGVKQRLAYISDHVAAECGEFCVLVPL